MKDIGKGSALISAQAKPPEHIPINLTQVVCPDIVGMPDTSEVRTGSRLSKILEEIDGVDRVNFWSPMKIRRSFSVLVQIYDARDSNSHSHHECHCEGGSIRANESELNRRWNRRLPRRGSDLHTDDMAVHRLAVRREYLSRSVAARRR